MAVEGLQSTELSIAEKTFVIITIPRLFRGNGLHVRVARHRDHGFRDDIVAVQAADGVVEALAIDVGVGTGAGLEMDLLSLVLIFVAGTDSPFAEGDEGKMNFLRTVTPAAVANPFLQKGH